MIHGVECTKLKIIHLEKGDVLRGLKASDSTFSGFGEAYFSSVLKDDIKGWKKHTEMTLNLIVPVGVIQVVIYDDRNNSNTFGCFESHTLSLENYCRLTIPSGLWVAFKGVGNGPNMLLNIASIEHDPTESEQIALTAINFDWSSSTND